MESPNLHNPKECKHDTLVMITDPNGKNTDLRHWVCRRTSHTLKSVSKEYVARRLTVGDLTTVYCRRGGTADLPSNRLDPPYSFIFSKVDVVVWSPVLTTRLSVHTTLRYSIHDSLTLLSLLVQKYRYFWLRRNYPRLPFTNFFPVIVPHSVNWFYGKVGKRSALTPCEVCPHTTTW